MNDYRSPFGDKKLTLIGILNVVVLATLIFATPFTYNKKYSDVEAAKAGTTTDATEATETDAFLLPQEIAIVETTYIQPADTYYLPSHVREQRRIVKQNDFMENQEYMPTCEKEVKTEVEIAEAEKKAEEARRYAAAKAAQTSYVAEEEYVEEEYYEETPAPSSGNGMTYYGGFELTAYEWSGNPCANGAFPTEGHTVACNSLPLGTKIYIEGLGEYVVEDTGGMGGGVIDIYMGDYGTCMEFGRQYGDVYIIE